jgi:glycosyltransferase involved in cell wall biosynthesis
VLELRILLIHNRYATYGGEDKVYDDMVASMIAEGHDVIPYTKSSVDIRNGSSFSTLRLIIHSFFGWKSKRELRAIVRKRKPDVAHLHNLYPIISSCVIPLLHKEGIPIFITLHNYRFVCANGLMFRNGAICTECVPKPSPFRVARHRCYHESVLQSFWYGCLVWQFRRQSRMGVVNCFIALNPFMRDMAISAGINVKNIIIIPNYFEALVPDNKKSVDHEPYFLILGRLSPEKGVDFALDAVMHAKESLPVIIVGEGPEEERLKKKASSMTEVRFEGFAYGKRKNELIANALALVITSVCHENFPTTVLEAMSLGTPVVVPRLGGVQYMVRDGIDGYIYEPGNPSSLTCIMQKMLHDTRMVKEMRKEAMASFHRLYDKKMILDKLQTAYRKEISNTK